MKTFYTIIFTFTFYFCGNGQELSELQKIKKLDSLFQELNAHNMSMGSISIYKDGHVFYSKTYGISNIIDGRTIPSSGKTVYRIGSVSKVFTAFMIMKQVEDHALSLEQTIDKFFPSLKNAQDITIRQLLSHKSILPVFVKVDDLEKLRQAENEDKLIRIVNSFEPNNNNTKTKYNNLNYILLGLILEKVSGKSYNENLSENLSPIGGLRVYGTYHLLNAARNEANSFHLEKDKWVEDYENTESPLSDGSGFLVSDAESLNLFFTGLFSEKILKQQYLNEMMPKEEKFGFGLIKTNFDEHKGYGHTGRIEGFTSALSYFPDDKISIAFVQNGSVYPLNDILIGIGNIMFDKPFKIPDLKKTTLNNAQEEKLTGNYENKEEGYKVIIERVNKTLRLRVAKGNGLFNKMIIPVSALKPNRLFNPSQGIIFDFSAPDKDKFTICEMRVNGAKLTLQREIPSD